MREVAKKKAIILFASLNSKLIQTWVNYLIDYT